MKKALALAGVPFDFFPASEPAVASSASKEKTPTLSDATSEVPSHSVSASNTTAASKSPSIPRSLCAGSRTRRNIKRALEPSSGTNVHTESGPVFETVSDTCHASIRGSSGMHKIATPTALLGKIEEAINNNPGAQVEAESWITLNADGSRTTNNVSCCHVPMDDEIRKEVANLRKKANANFTPNSGNEENSAYEVMTSAALSSDDVVRSDLEDNKKDSEPSSSQPGEITETEEPAVESGDHSEESDNVSDSTAHDEVPVQASSVPVVKSTPKAKMPKSSKRGNIIGRFFKRLFGNKGRRRLMCRSRPADLLARFERQKDKMLE